MNKKISLFRPLLYFLSAVCVCMALLSAFFNAVLFYLLAAVAGLSLVFVFVKLRRAEKEIEAYMGAVGTTIAQLSSEALIALSVPVVLLSEEGEVTWYNERAQEVFEGHGTVYGRSINEWVEGFAFAAPCPEHGFDITLFSRRYSAHTSRLSGEGEGTFYAVYLIDDNDLKQSSEAFFATRPAYMLITIDNYEELVQSAKDVERLYVINEIELEIERFAEGMAGMFLRLDKDEFVIMMEDSKMAEVLEHRFRLLDEVRSIVVTDRVPCTLSIGVSRNAGSLLEAQQQARQALDMALGRGGDQAALRTHSGYEFYGGMSKGVEKRTKVKTRIIANALHELIESSDHVIIMGHSFADLDCFGSAVGLLRAVTELGKPGHIAIDREKNLVEPLIARVEENGYDGLILSPQALMDTVTEHTLLIIVDAHTEHILESPELYRRCENVVVIDHHRRMVGHISDAVIFYHEPFASSASEMVAELTQYLGQGIQLGRIEAEALLAGIMLDTKNFVIKTGVRTFEAAAYLRKLGADTVEVRKLFASSMGSYQRRTRLVAEAEIYRGCAVTSTVALPGEEIKVIAPQAADELLGISDVEASFVLYEHENTISFSARSMGELNVQVIMEKLGGGGHHTMAGAQLENTSLEDARLRLLRAIDEYRDSQRGDTNI